MWERTSKATQQDLPDELKRALAFMTPETPHPCTLIRPPLRVTVLQPETEAVQSRILAFSSQAAPVFAV